MSIKMAIVSGFLALYVCVYAIPQDATKDEYAWNPLYDLSEVRITVTLDGVDPLSNLTEEELKALVEYRLLLAGIKVNEDASDQIAVYVPAMSAGEGRQALMPSIKLLRPSLMIIQAFDIVLAYKGKVIDTAAVGRRFVDSCGKLAVWEDTSLGVFSIANIRSNTRIWVENTIIRLMNTKLH